MKMKKIYGMRFKNDNNYMKNLQHITISLLLIIGMVFSSKGQNIASQVDKAISAGDIVRTGYSDTAKINLYQGNGRFGSCFGSLGLHNNPYNKKNNNRYGNTEFIHINHWVRAKFNADYLIPLIKVYWSDEPSVVTNYTQQQLFYNGMLKTSFEANNGKVSVETWFDPVDKDLSGISIDVKGRASDVIIDPLQTLSVHYSQQMEQKAEIIRHSRYFEIQLTCMDKKSSLFLSTNDSVAITGKRLIVKLHSGRNTLLISYDKPVQTSCEVSKKRSTQWWNQKWSQTGRLLLPDKNAQRLWVSSMSTILSTCNDDKRGLPPPMGFTGNGWSFAFPQDLSYIHSVLLTTGNIKIAKSWIEYFAEGIQGMKAYTKKLYGVDGICLPWVYPYGSFKNYHEPSPPNIFFYEIHNSGYLCRMACETAKYVNDTAWTNKNVLDLIRQTALFYRNIAKKGSDGLWHMSIEPSMGQDEMGGFNQKDYLCALFSAKYCFQQAIAYNLDPEGIYKTILSDGLAFPALKSSEGFYFTNKDGKNEDFGKQKHPVQLNELAYLPVSDQVSQPALSAYQKRYNITQNAKIPIFYGWTLGEFLLAGSRVGDVNGWKKDWNNLRKANYVDAEWIQLYESSGGYGASFYTTTNSLVVQSLITNLVDDWFHKLEIAKCNPWKGDVYFNNIYSLLGIFLNGEINGTNATLHLTAWKDCQFDLCDRKLQMKKGQIMRVKISNGTLLAVNLQNNKSRQPTK